MGRKQETQQVVLWSQPSEDGYFNHATGEHTTPEDAKNQQDELIYYLARFVYPIAGQMTPSGKATWGERFQQISGERLQDYIERARNENYRERFKR